MAADDETKDAVRRILKKRPPEDLPSGAEARLRQRLDEEAATRRAARAVTRPARPTERKKKPKTVR
jgi:hypothetical protein